jgi:hypothetical protein
MVESYAEGWPQYYLPTIKTLAKGGEAIDISNLLLQQTRRRGIFDPLDFFSYARIRRLLPLRWDPSVFTVTDEKIALNADNRDVLLRLLRKCGDIKIEQTDAGDG